ncbi:hypothetical protein CARUB_v10024801mg [Capsella rubella]|uniref:Uncharacterized protein n=1 Tax=Capsella rubella TaxID=81985 RepID=R0HWY8_9BRAS|nr:transcription factor MYB12 [Capsella rubella]EOA28583.1 hypothetical protein CARUB_v10024801mg [Capsella rubella]
MGRAPCCEKVGIKRGRWTAEEDQILSNYIQSNGQGSWRSLPKNAGLKRCGKSCRLRWINYLRSDLKRGNISPEEEELVVKLHSTFGNRWSLIASHLPGRTDNEIKNYWNSHLSRKLHNFISKPSISRGIIMNASSEPQAKRRLGRTSRSAMKPKTHRTKTRKTKKTPTRQDPNADVAVAEEGALMVALSGADREAELGPCDYYGDFCCNKDLVSINGDSGVLSFDDDIADLLLDESDPGYVSCGGDDTRGFWSESSNQGKLDCLQSCPSVESFLNYEHQVNDASADEYIDWDCVWQEGSKHDLWHQKEGADSMVSWLLDGDDDAMIGKNNCDNFGEPLDHDDENALVAWLLS